jgi:hypothetical protein
MSEHIWAQEQIAAYVAEGLTAEEKERFEAHWRECPECAAELERDRALDRGLGSLFASVRPAASLEDRMVRSLHVIKAVDLLRPRWKRNALIGIAASLGLGLAGATVSSLAGDGGLALPGAGRLKIDMPGFLAVTDTNGNRLQSEIDNESKQIAAYTGILPGGPVDRLIYYANSPTAQAKREGLEGGADIGYYPPSLALKTESPPAYQPYVRDPNAPTSGSSNGGASKALGINGNNKGGQPPGTFLGSGTPGSRADDLNQEKSGEKPEIVARRGLVDDDSSVSSDLGSTPPKLGKIPFTNRLFKPGEHRPQVTGNYGPTGFLNSPYPKGVVSGSTPSGVSTPELAVPAPGNWSGQADPKTGASNKPANADPAPSPPPPAIPQKIIIRTGEVEFEIDSFDSAVANVFKLVNAIKGGFVATVNSEKLANGKVKGSIVVRVPPEALDGLVLDLRRDLGKGGELKGQRIGSQDITKQYTDMESRLKAARTMETRLLQIIKEGKGEIKQLLEAERELGNWRTKIEEMEGELRYYANQVSLSTLTITLAEKEIRSAVGIIESERVQTGIEVEEVDRAQQQLLAAVTEAKGRITKSEMKQLGSGQFNATVDFEVAPERAGALRDRLRQLGTVARLEIDRIQKAEGGTPQKDSKVTRGETQFFVQLYNVARMAARETTTLQLAAPDVASAYQSLKNAVLQAKGRILHANLDEQDRQNVNGVLDFEVRRADEAAIQTAIDGAGDVLSRVVSRSDEGDSVTDAKVHYQATLTSSARISPRATYTLGVEVGDVEKTISVFTAQVANVKGRIVESNVAHQRNGQVSARFVCNVPLAAAPTLAEEFKNAGIVHTQQVGNDLKAPDGKLALARFDVSLGNGDVLVSKDSGLWPQVHKGLVYSANFLLVSLTWVIFGLCAVLPWAVAGYFGYRIIRWMTRKPA